MPAPLAVVSWIGIRASGAGLLGAFGTVMSMIRLGCALVGSKMNGPPRVSRSISMQSLFGTEPIDGATVTLVVSAGLIVVVAAARLVAKVVVIVAALSEVEPSSTVTPL
jgi:hypothetical protein